MKRMYRGVINMLMVFSITSIGNAQPRSAHVFAVHDGDSYSIKIEGQDTKKWVRLWGVDCPEVISNYVTLDQPYGREVADSVRLLIKRKDVLIDSIGVDRYNRTVVRVLIDSIDLTEHILQKGWGWYSLDSNLTSTQLDWLKSLHNTAKINLVGLWGVPGRKYRPSTWRRLYKR